MVANNLVKKYKTDFYVVTYNPPVWSLDFDFFVVTYNPPVWSLMIFNFVIKNSFYEWFCIL